MKVVKINEVVLVHCNIVSNSYQQNSKVLYTFIPNKSFGQLFHMKFYIFKNFLLRIFIY